MHWFKQRIEYQPIIEVESDIIDQCLMLRPTGYKLTYCNRVLYQQGLTKVYHKELV